MRGLQWLRDCELDFDDGALVGGTVTLQAEHSKNKVAYTLPLRGELLEVIRRAWANRESECPNVFHDGKTPIGDFRKAWARHARPRDSTALSCMTCGGPARETSCALA